MPQFKANQQLRARDLNALEARAQRQALQSPSAGLYNNGQGLVPRNPRRTPPRRSSGDTIITNSLSVIAKITGGDAVSGYILECYPNYPDLVTDKFSAVAFIPAISLGGYVVSAPPEDTYIVAHYLSLTSIGGN